MTRRSIALLIVACVAVGIFGLIAGLLGYGDRGSKEVPNTAHGRREFVRIWQDSLPGSALSTEGDADKGIVVNTNDCNLAALNELLAHRELTKRLDQFDFEWIRCSDSKIKVTSPWK